MGILVNFISKMGKGYKKDYPISYPSPTSIILIMVHKGAGDLKYLWVELLAVAVVVGDFVVVTVTVLDGVTDHDIVAVTEHDVVVAVQGYIFLKKLEDAFRKSFEKSEIFRKSFGKSDSKNNYF